MQLKQKLALLILLELQKNFLYSTLKGFSTKCESEFIVGNSSFSQFFFFSFDAWNFFIQAHFSPSINTKLLDKFIWIFYDLLMFVFVCQQDLQILTIMSYHRLTHLFTNKKGGKYFLKGTCFFSVTLYKKLRLPEFQFSG